MEYLKPYPTSAEGYRIELAKKSRVKEILKLLRENYHDDEVLSKCLKANTPDINDEGLKLIEEDEDNMIIAVYESSPCLIAVHNETDEVVGVTLTLLSRKPEAEDEDGAASAALFGSNTFKSAVINEYYNYLSKIDRKAGIFKKYPDAKVAMELFAVCVHKEHRRKGIAKDLFRTLITIAKHIPEVSVIFGFYTSLYSKKVAEQIGMENILDIDVEQEFKDAKGDPVFRDIHPNNIVSVMVLEVPALE